jgi:hypothetical protein
LLIGDGSRHEMSVACINTPGNSIQ